MKKCVTFKGALTMLDGLFLRYKETVVTSPYKESNVRAYHKMKMTRNAS